MPGVLVKEKKEQHDKKTVHFEEKSVAGKPFPQRARRASAVGKPVAAAEKKEQNVKTSSEPSKPKGLSQFFGNQAGSIAMHSIANMSAIMKSKMNDATFLTKPLPSDIGVIHKEISPMRRRSTITLYSTREAMSALSQIQESKKERAQLEIKSKLMSIKKRVKKTLEAVEMDSDSDDDDDDGGSLEPKVKFPPIYDTRAEREKMNERNYILGKVDSFEEKAILRKQYLTELNFWFSDNLDMCHDVVTPDEMKDMMTEAQELHRVITKSLIQFINNGDLVVDKGKQLLMETSKIIAERKAQMAKKTRKERIIVYDDKILLSDPLKWESSAKTIISIFEDCQKMIKNLMFKNALKLGQRQFDYMMVATEKRYKDLDDKRKQCNELQGKLHMAKVQSDKLTKEIEEQKKKSSKLTSELTETKQNLDKLRDRNLELSQKIIELNAKIRFLEEELRKKLKTPTPPPTPPPPPEPEKIIVKVVDSATELKLQEVEIELQQAKEEIERLISNLNAVSEDFQAEQEKNRQLQEKITDLENAPPTVITAPANSPAVQPSPLPVEIPTDKDSSYYKTLMSGMKKEFETELEKVKVHMKKEKSRGEAGVRKLEMQHKDQLSTIQKDTIRILRAIMHFRDRMMTCLEKENLIDQAQALQDLGSLVKDKLSPEPRDVLATVVGAVVDYLHNMEGILENGVLALKVLMRYQMDKQIEHEVQLRLAKEQKANENRRVASECKKKQKHLKSTKKDIGGLAKRLKKARNKLKKYQHDIEQYSGDKRYSELMQRYNTVIKLYKSMQKEMEVLQSDFHDTMQRKLQEKETMVISQMKMQIRQERVVKEEQLKLSIMDQKENLRLLSRAYEDNKISKELHLMATAMIQKTMEIPQRKLQNLLEQYITFRTVNESKERVQSVLNDKEAELAIDTRREMEAYLEQMDEKFTSSMWKWRQKMRELETEKRDLNKKIYKLFNEVLLETGILLVHPLLKGTNRRNILTQAATTLSRNQMKDLLFRRRKGFKGLMDMPDGLQGSSVPFEQGTDRYWSIQTPPSEPKPGVVAPHMLAYEINKPRMRATRGLMNKERATVSLGKTESFAITDQNYLQFLRNSSTKGLFQGIVV